MLMLLGMLKLNSQWSVRLSREAEEDFLKFDSKQQSQIKRAVDKFSLNPLPKSEGGYGNPLHGELAGYFKIKLVNAGIRVLYTLKRRKNRMIVVLIGMRRDDEVYEIALERLQKFRERRLRRRK